MTERIDVDIDTGWFVREMPKGLRTKYELCPVGVELPISHWQWYWKSAVSRAPYEVWSEVLAHEMGQLVGVDVPICYPSRCGETWGVLVKSFLMTPNDTLMHGGDLLGNFDPHYDRDKGTRCSLQLIYMALNHLRMDDHREQFFKTLVFDALIGNMDRHQENWGLVIENLGENFGLGISPAFDNGASLAKEFKTDSDMAKKFGGGALETYAERGTSEVRWESNGSYEHLTHFEFMRRHFETFDWSREVASNVLGYNDVEMDAVFDRIRSLSQSCEGIEISEYRAEKIRELVAYRRKRILEML